VDSPREHDQSLEQLLRQSLKTRRRAGVTDRCLDAEILAAWTDGGLSGAALEEAQLHVADCARCQDLVGTLARIHSDVAVTEPARSSRRWLAWAVPLTAAAAAAALWLAVPDRNALVSPPAREQLQGKENGQVAVPGSAPQAPPADGRQMFSARQEPSTPGARETTAVPQTGVAPQAPARQDARAEKKEAAGNDATRDVSADKLAATGIAGGKREADNLAKASEPAAPAASSPAAAAAPQPFAAERALGRARTAQRTADAAGTEILSPDPAVRWRIIGSALQHSSNGGSTWQAASTGVAAELTAGAAPSATVCWLVGRSGVVLLTTDGRTWRRIAFPEMTDLSAVFTVDAGGNVASVSTVDGRTFVTTDAGATWVVR
jgi:hypothetical protein